MYLFQTAREELYRQIGRHRHLVTGRVLDVGAGAAARYRHLFEYSEYVLLDTTRYTEEHIVGSADALPFEAQSFDTIVCTQVIGDVYKPANVFAECYRVLKQGGCALITESFIDPLHDEPNDYWRFTPHSLRRLAEDAGFTVEVLEPRGGYRSVMAQLRTRYWIERLDLYHSQYGWVAKKIFALLGRLALVRDRRDKSSASRMFAHGYLLVVRKPARAACLPAGRAGRP